MSDARMITWGEYLRKFPSFFTVLPRFKKGLDFAKDKPGERIGLAWGVEQAAQANPDGKAVIYQDRSITYKELDQWANRIANHLASKGVGARDVVSVFIENRPELLAVTTAVSKLGAISALVNTSQKGKVLVHSINLVDPKLLVLGEEGLEAIQEIRNELKIEDDEYLYLADNDTLKERASSLPEGCADLSDFANRASKKAPPIPDLTMNDYLFYIYTSGTTGLPKAAKISIFRWTSSFGGIGYAGMRLNKDDVFYSTLPLYHATGMVVCWGTALAGQCAFAIRRKFSAREFWNDCIKYKVTAIGYVGELCRYLINQPETSLDQRHQVKTMLGNGLRPGVWGEFKQRFNIERVMELYSASESNVGMINIFNFDESVGFQMGKSTLVEYDKDTEEPLRGDNGLAIKTKKGGKGLLLGKITKENPFDGYTDDDKSESKIVRNVLKEGDAWFNTGDVMRDIGFMHLQFVDRLGDTYRWKGENVSTTEVENIMTDCDHVTEAVAYGVEIPNTNGRAGMASICLDQDHSEFDFSNLHQQLSKEMPAYAVPVFLRIREQMETTGTFKHKKSDLKEESYDLSKVSDPVYVLLPGEKSYSLVTEEVQKGIDSGEYRF
jgi:citronellyl-CoA synthetase